MATSTRCSVCRKETSAIFCTGCNAHFCMKDLKGHRDKLSTELDGIIEERDNLQESINKGTQYPNSSSPFIVQINEWQKNMIRKIDQVAEQARQSVIELLDVKRTQLATEFKGFSQELLQRKDSENFVEYDLVRLRKMVEQFGQELKKLSHPSTIELHTEESDRIEWSRLIYIEVKPSNTIYQSQEQQRKLTISYFRDRLSHNFFF